MELAAAGAIMSKAPITNSDMPLGKDSHTMTDTPTIGPDGPELFFLESTR
jgi:hypothetical protein